MTEHQIDTSSVDPAALARTVAETPDAQLAEGMRGPLRQQILDEVFARMADHARPERIRDVDAVIHWKIGDRPEGGHDHYEVVIRDGACAVSERPTAAPRVTFTIGGVDFLKLVTGNANGPALFMNGKLKVEGELLFSAQVAGLFSIPAAGD